MSDTQDWNQQVIEDFRANAGKVGGPFEGASLLLLHTTGAKSGAERVTPIMYQDLGEGRVAVFASKAGADTHPDWYHNVVANPSVDVEIGSDNRTFNARIATGDERNRIWDTQKAMAPGFADYEAKTSREIPVVVLEPAD